jgi:hypothetical protein
MANFESKKIDFSQINKGVKFENGDVVSAEAINAPIEASAYAQEVAEEAKRIAEESGGGGSVDLSNYVQKDQFAENEAGKGGLVRGFDAKFGLGQNKGANSVYIIQANEQDIARKMQQYCPIVPKTLDLAVKTSVTTNTIDLSDDEKTSACEWLGAVKDVSVKDVILTKDVNGDTNYLSFGINAYPYAVPQRDVQGKLRTNTPNDTDDEITVVNIEYIKNNTPTIYTDANENNTTKKLRIYTDNFGYLHIDTE